MARRIFGWAAGIVVVAVALFLIFGPGIAESSMNKVTGGPWPVSARAKALHAKLFVADMHADTLLWKRDFADRADRGQVDLPRLQDGHVALQILSSVTKTPKGQNYESNSDRTDNITLLAVAQLQPVRTWTSLLERSLWHAEKLDRDVAADPQALRLVLTRRDLAALATDQGLSPRPGRDFAFGRGRAEPGRASRQSRPALLHGLPHDWARPLLRQRARRVDARRA